MTRFELYRVRTEQPKQVSIFQREPSSLLRSAILDRPSAELRTGYKWHIGNVEELDSAGIYFRLGRTTRGITQLWDSTSRNFVDQDMENAPYTHVVMDVELGSALIGANRRLAPTINGIARQFARLLNMWAKHRGVRAHFHTAQINDPRDFISQLHLAYAVTRFSMTVSLPNHFDVNKDFHLPFEQLLRETDGTSGRVEIKGEALDSHVLEELARSAASTGENVTASIRPGPGQKPVHRQLRGDPIRVEHETLESSGDKQRLLRRLRSLYLEVRGHD